MDGLGHTSHYARVRVLPHIKKLDDCFGQFLVRVVCDCGACREIEPSRTSRRDPSLTQPCATCELHHRSLAGRSIVLRHPAQRAPRA
jgi:hypothetical protein